MPRKSNANSDPHQLIELGWPFKGLDLRAAQTKQPPLTTADCLNVRAFEPNSDRNRGAQRSGLSKYLDAALGTPQIQLLDHCIMDPSQGFPWGQGWSYVTSGTQGTMVDLAGNIITTLPAEFGQAAFDSEGSGYFMGPPLLSTNPGSVKKRGPGDIGKFPKGMPRPSVAGINFVRDLPLATATVLPITRTAKGTATGTTSATIAGVTLRSDEVLVVMGAAKGALGEAAATYCTFNGQITTSGQLSWNATGSMTAAMYFFSGLSTQTGDIVFTSYFAVPISTAVVATIIKRTLLTHSHETKKMATGSSDTPSSGATVATTVAAQMVMGMVATQGPLADTDGTWSNGFTNGQVAGTALGTTDGNGLRNDVKVSEGYLLVAATAAYTAAKTGITSRSWVAGVSTHTD